MRMGTAVSACLLDCSKAFDKCQFDKLFEKLIIKGLPAVVVRVLIFIYEEQEGCVKLEVGWEEVLQVQADKWN